jgi:hypothetical protein
MKRLRIGIILFIISWLPIAQGILIIAHNHQKLTSDHASEVLRITVLYRSGGRMASRKSGVCFGQKGRLAQNTKEFMAPVLVGV